LLLYSSYLPLGVPNGPVVYFINSIASAITSSAISIDFTAISTNIDVSYDEEGVVLPKG
jgi:uncharacterized protein YqgV (UPF0045/DUF77 family)